MGGGGGGGTSLYKLFRYVGHQRVWFFSLFCLKMGIDFRNFGLKTGMDAGDQAPDVQNADNFIHWIGRYLADEMCARFSR